MHVIGVYVYRGNLNMSVCQYQTHPLHVLVPACARALHVLHARFSKLCITMCVPTFLATRVYFYFQGRVTALNRPPENISRLMGLEQNFIWSFVRMLVHVRISFLFFFLVGL